MRTTLITLTRGDRSRWFPEMLASVPPGVEHRLVTVPAESPADQWAEARFLALAGADTPFVGLLDDDDVLLPGAVEQCEQALTATGAALAFTYEAQIDTEGALLSVRNQRVRYGSLRMHPRAAHHFSLLRRETLSEQALEVEYDYGCGFDWWTRAQAAFDPRFNGAVQVSMIGYQWRQHAAQQSRREKERAFYVHSPSIAARIFHELVRRDETEFIPVYQ
jgi:hypothetical protein